MKLLWECDRCGLALKVPFYKHEHQHVCQACMDILRGGSND